MYCTQRHWFWNNSSQPFLDSWGCSVLMISFRQWRDFLPQLCFASCAIVLEREKLQVFYMTLNYISFWNYTIINHRTTFKRQINMKCLYFYCLGHSCTQRQYFSGYKEHLLIDMIMIIPGSAPDQHMYQGYAKSYHRSLVGSYVCNVRMTKLVSIVDVVYYLL